MSRCVVYLISGPSHLPYLVVSLYTLRQHWGGDVLVYAWPESYDLARQIALDRRLNITRVTEREPVFRPNSLMRFKQNHQPLDRILLACQLKGNVDSMLYLDADTTVHGSLEPLFEQAERVGFCGTQYCDQVTTDRPLVNRLQWLYHNHLVDTKLVDVLIREPWSGMNGGVWSARPDSPILPIWYQWTLGSAGTIMADELMLHPMQVRFCPDRMEVAKEHGRWNSSPRYRSSHLRDEDVRIYHYHGHTSVKLRSGFGRRKWGLLYKQCREDNLGGIMDWRDGVVNEYLNEAEREGWLTR